MTREQVKHVMKLISFVYSNFEVSKEKVDIWYDLLADEPFDLVLSNAKRHVKEKTYPPTIAELCHREERPAYYKLYVHNVNAGEDWTQ
ncbi:replicative helicase loader/inhibitor [Geobacillus stearothermophilus]|uniref:replicative helicase loader/inhibitor n=1 Tax=Geobacillus stearothermophilus TaxID=1422 RepID=UPI002E1D2015|nr:replicative helicase loader/inhibitor [Geobacillus stearothermophilus]